MQAQKNDISPIILAVETSCDETACALLVAGRVVGEKIYSQWRRHSAFGGVVPELASRDHTRRLLPLVADLLQDAPTPTHFAYTRGPGLSGALLAGATFANAMAFARNVPAIAVNHLTGHLLSPRLSRPDFAFPYLALLVSGGHTQLWHVKTATEFHLLGKTLDDAAGEAFDKTAILLGLGYPGGAALEKLATQGEVGEFTLPCPAQKDFNFSFSGLKTAVRRLHEKHPHRHADIAATFQQAAAVGLAKQTANATREIAAERIAIVGGVAQNAAIWAQMRTYCPEADLHRPLPSHCSDNAAMIALAAFLQLDKTLPATETDYAFSVSPRWQPEQCF